MAVTAVPVIRLARYTALEVEDLVFDSARFERVDPVARGNEDSALKALSLTVELACLVPSQ